MISAITNRGELNFMVFEGTFTNTTFIEFMKRMIKQATRKIYRMRSTNDATQRCSEA